jgi:hypothetical protein
MGANECRAMAVAKDAAAGAEGTKQKMVADETERVGDRVREPSRSAEKDSGGAEPSIAEPSKVEAARGGPQILR